MYYRVSKLFKELSDKTDQIMSKQQMETEVTDFDLTNLEMIIRDIHNSEEFKYLKEHFPSQAQVKRVLLDKSMKLLEEFKKIETSTKINSRVFNNYDTKNNRQKRVLSLEKFYNRTRNSEISIGQSGLRNSSSVLLHPKMKINSVFPGKDLKGGFSNNQIDSSLSTRSGFENKLRQKEKEIIQKLSARPTGFEKKRISGQELIEINRTPRGTNFNVSRELPPSKNAFISHEDLDDRGKKLISQDQLHIPNSFEVVNNKLEKTIKLRKKRALDNYSMNNQISSETDYTKGSRNTNEFMNNEGTTLRTASTNFQMEYAQDNTSILENMKLSPKEIKINDIGLFDGQVKAMSMISPNKFNLLNGSFPGK